MNVQKIPGFGFYNMDCMEGMKQFPDKYFDLAIVDPPYGAGFTENGGCSGWFEKYKPKPDGGGYWNRFGQRFDRYKKQDTLQTDCGRDSNRRNGGEQTAKTKKL